MHFVYLAVVLVAFVGISWQQQQPNNNNGYYGPQIDITNDTGRVALLWTSISVAVITSLLQGLITTIVQIAEDQGLWTFR